MRSNTPAILLVEDDRPTLELYRRELSSEYRVSTCTDAGDALEVLHSQDLCAVVLEPAVFGGRGWSLLSAIKNASKGRSIPVIVCSVLDERKRGLEMGATAYMVKPVLPTTLLATLRRFTKSDSD